MYIVIRKYDLVPGTTEEYIYDVQKSLVPILKKESGLRDFTVAEVADNELVTISVFDSLTDAKESAQETAAWVAEHTETFFQGFSKPMAGPVRVHCESGSMQQMNHEELLRGVF